MRILFVMLCAVMVSLSCSVARDVPMDVSLCSLLAESTAYDGQLVTLRASVESDGRHLTLLTDAACSGAGIALVVDDGIVEDENVVAIREAIVAQRFGTPSKRIEGTFTGVLRLHPGEVPSRVLLTRTVSNVVVSDGDE